MRFISIAAAAMAAVVVSACSPYHQASPGLFPFGASSVVSRVTGDAELASRYPRRADEDHSRFPEGALAPAPRPVAEDRGTPVRLGWKLTPLEREAEKRTKARGLPHAVAEPWGPAAGHRR